MWPIHKPPSTSISYSFMVWLHYTIKKNVNPWNVHSNSCKILETNNPFYASNSTHHTSFSSNISFFFSNRYEFSFHLHVVMSSFLDINSNKRYEKKLFRKFVIGIEKMSNLKNIKAFNKGLNCKNCWCTWYNIHKSNCESPHTFIFFECQNEKIFLKDENFNIENLMVKGERILNFI